MSLAPRVEVSDPTRVTLYTGGPVASVREMDHELFGRLWAPEGPDDLANVLGAATHASAAMGWRGQASLVWRFDSGLARRILTNRDQLRSLGEVPLETQMRELESRLLSRARLAGHGQRDGRSLSDLELLAVLQHHGAATRLVDCTANAYVALWFACRDVGAQYGLLAAFDLSEAKSVQTAAQLEEPIGDLVGQAEGALCAWRPSALSPRIAAQQGLFVFSEAVEETWGSVALVGRRWGNSGTVPRLRLFGISPGLKATMRELWREMFGYTEETLFPDLDGFARIHGALQPFAAEMCRGG